MITRPGVVGGTFEKMHLRKQTQRDAFVKEYLDAVGLGADDEQLFTMGQDLKSDADEAGFYLAKEICPIRALMGPRQLHTALGVPLGRQKRGTDFGLLGASLFYFAQRQCQIADNGSGRSKMNGHK